MIDAIETRTVLLQHQAEAVTKLLPTRVGALFMEMGTGKSRTAIELARLRQDKISKVLWCCPVSLKETIKQEILKHTDCDESDICVFDSKTNERNLPDTTWYVIGIESVSSSDRVALTVNHLIDQHSMVIVDESSFIKGHKSMRTQRLTLFAKRARYRLILTGTPISQGIVDLFAQMRFLSPKILGYASFYSFANNHLQYSDKYKGMITSSHNSDWVAAKIRPYVYQVTKSECLNLPDKLYESVYCSMTSEQSEYYQKAKEELLDQLTGEDMDRYVILKLFTNLQQISCGFWNRRTERHGEMHCEFISMKHERLTSLLETIERIADDKKIIVWAKYRYDIEQINAALTNLYGANCCALFYGDLNEQRRTLEVQNFRQDSRFFLATPSCGGMGLTLNEAHTVIFYNNGFKYAERIQAEDRCHRIGQVHKVTYIDIWSDAGIDGRISTALETKGDVVQAFKEEVDKIKTSNKDKLRELINKL